MRLIISLCVAASLLWWGYWFVGSRGLQSGLEAWFEARRADGWQAEWSDISVAGFPNRFDTTITDLALADPAAGLAWDMPFFQLLQLSYKPNHVIAVWPLTQTLSTPIDRYLIQAREMQASLKVEADTRIPLDNITMVIDSWRLRGSEWLLEAATLRSAMQRVEGTETAYDLGLETTAMLLPVHLRRQLDPAGLQPDTIETMRLDAQMTFDRPWDRFAIEIARPQPVSIDLREMRATWGELDLRAAGDLTVDEIGRPTGTITVKAKNWREILAVIERSGLIPLSFMPLIERALEAAAGLSGPSSSLDLPLTLRDGQMSLGLIPLGEAPRLILR